MRHYLFDTNVLSALIKRPASPLAEKIFALERTAYCTSIIVASELRYGVLKKGSKALQEKVEQLLEQVDVLPLENDASHYYASIRSRLEKSGQPISANDMFIAAHAMALRLTVVTANVGEFSRIANLRTENWLDA